MKIGMLWFDNSKSRLEEKVQQAAAYYQAKHGRKPNVCMVHPKMMPPDFQQNGVEVRTSPSILPHHLWIGVEEQP